jgi:hypothetical protein
MSIVSKLRFRQFFVPGLSPCQCSAAVRLADNMEYERTRIRVSILIASSED